MKRKYVKKNILVVSILFMVSVILNASDLDDCKSMLKFYYVANPNSTTDTVPILLNNTNIAAGTETGAFWTSGNTTRAKELVRSIMRSSQNAGDQTLQYYIAAVLRILNKPVRIYIYNDVSDPLNADAADRWKMCEDQSTVGFRAWPCASNQAKSDDMEAEWERCNGRPIPPRNDNWGGTIHLGAYHLNANQLIWAKGVIVHELVHTQDVSDGRLHLFIVAGQNFSYGFDNNHYPAEAIPNMAWAYGEGIANTITLLYEGSLAQQRFNWFSTNGLLAVEINPYPQGTGPNTTCFSAMTPSSDAWLYNRIIASGLSPAATSTGYAHFRIRSLTPEIIIHNEFIQALIFSEYVRHISFERYMDALTSSNNQLFRVCASGIASLFQTMCEFGLPEGETLASVSNQSTSEPKKYLLPLAFADYFTAYRATTKAEFKAIFENMISNGWIDLYWDGERANVRSSVPLTATPNFGDLTSIAIALGINTSEPY